MATAIRAIFFDFMDAVLKMDARPSSFPCPLCGQAVVGVSRDPAPSLAVGLVRGQACREAADRLFVVACPD
jgi:predicted RNA-binding Zn-ribbon protein involved in translation (DUF1610 family)